MKKTIIALMALAGAAGAVTTTEFLDLSQDRTIEKLSYDVETGKITTATTHASTKADYNLYEIDNNGPQGLYTFKVNLTKASEVTSNTDILTLNFDGTSNFISAIATADGLTIGKSGTTHSTVISWETLLGKDSVSTGNDGNQYIVLTLAHIPSYNTAAGTWLGDETGTLVNDGDYAYKGQNRYITDVTVNNTLVAAISTYSGWKPEADRPAFATAFATTATNSLTVPEPTTATLSLLALAGLAARRRRK